MTQSSTRLRLTALEDLMKRFPSEIFFRLAADLQSLMLTTCRYSGDTYLDKKTRSLALALITQRLTPDCKHVHLKHSIAMLERIRDLLKYEAATWGNLGSMLQDFHWRIEDEMRSLVFMQIDPDKMAYFDADKLPFGKQVAEEFPELIDEISEAAMCLGCGRNTACVFHLMRIVDEGLKRLARQLGVERLGTSWGGILRETDRKLKELDSRPKNEASRRKEQFIADVQLAVDAMRRTWRNPVVHEVARNFSDEQAERVFNAVCEFMQLLASGAQDGTLQEPVV